MTAMTTPYLVYGLTRSYFTRKVTGYLDYTDRLWRLEPGINDHPVATEAGWEGGIPIVTDPNGEMSWDSTSIIEGMDRTTPAERSVIPDDPTLAFLAFLLDDFSDEWFYRPAVGSRWSYGGNTEVAGWQATEELSATMPVPAAFLREQVVAAMQASLPKLGVTGDNIDSWMLEVLVPYAAALNNHFGEDGYLLGGRPCIADFAIFGANAAHFVADPFCRDYLDEHGPTVVAHTYRLLMPQRQTFGEWFSADDVPDTLITVLAEAGRHYLPWVAKATVDGSASFEFESGARSEIASSGFLDAARGIMLARYVEARNPELDAILERAGIIKYFADHVDQATEIPDPTKNPRPTNNRPYPIN